MNFGSEQSRVPDWLRKETCLSEILYYLGAGIQTRKAGSGTSLSQYIYAVKIITNFIWKLMWLKAKCR
jgi:hypothetical protein